MIGSTFFFKAEDGIRDTSVTGVQTCALPIYPVRRVSPQHRPVPHGLGKIFKVPMKRKAGNHGIEQPHVQSILESGSQAVGCSIKPDLADSRVDRSRQQKPDPFHTSGTTVNGGWLDVAPCREKI